MDHEKFQAGNRLESNGEGFFPGELNLGLPRALVGCGPGAGRRTKQLRIGEPCSKNTLLKYSYTKHTNEYAPPWQIPGSIAMVRRTTPLQTGAPSRPAY